MNGDLHSAYFCASLDGGTHQEMRAAKVITLIRPIRREVRGESRDRHLRQEMLPDS